MKIMVASRERDLSPSPAKGPRVSCSRAFHLSVPTPACLNVGSLTRWLMYF